MTTGVNMPIKNGFPMPVRSSWETWPGNWKKFHLTPWCHVVIVTRGHEQDGVALAAVIRSPVRYLGMIGSPHPKKPRSTPNCWNRGLNRICWTKVHAPIGLNIGAETPEEIAVAIMAEIISVGRDGKEKNKYQAVKRFGQ